ncbi:MAG: hypothetical protein GF375_02000, partial [Candidatus Omnitrophica bacterium]|nr:hypothetical protein [Candidatus Omnitrophota bacterium]
MKKILSFVLLISLTLIVYGQESSLRKICEGKYFTIYGPAGLDTYSLLKRLNYDYFLHPDTALSGDRECLEDTLSKTLDSIFSE